MKVGDRVLLPLYSGTWRERVLVSARDLVALPQLAVVDLNLNGEMAHDLINRLHELHIPVVLVMGLVSKLPKMVAATLQKPFSGAELLETLCNVVDSNHLVTRASVAAR